MIKYLFVKVFLLLVIMIIYIPIIPLLFLFLILSMIADFLEKFIKHYEAVMNFKWIRKIHDNHLIEKIKLNRESNND